MSQPLPPLLSPLGEASLTPTQWKVLWTQHHRRLVRLTRALRQAPRVGWSVFEPWWAHLRDCRALIAWADERQKLSPPTQMTRWQTQVNHAIHQVMLSKAVAEKGRWFDWLSRQSRSNHPRQKWAQGVLDSLDTHVVDQARYRQLNKDLVHQTGAAARRELAFARPTQRTTLHCAWSADLRAEFNGAPSREVRQRAQERGLTGALLLPHDHVTLSASLLRSPSRRERLWRHSRRSPHKVSDCNKMLALRQGLAEVQGKDTWLASQLRSSAVRDIASIKAWLDDGMDRAGRALSRAYSRLTPIAQPFSEGPLTQAPWDRGFVQAYGRINATDWENTPLDAFPLEHVLEQAIPDMLAVGGWRTTGFERREQGWRVPVRHDDGREHTLWVVAVPDGQPSWTWYALGLSSTNDEMVLRTGWTLGTKHATWEQLRLLAHEVGHVLHAWSLGPSSHYDAWDATAKDWGEFPSQLMERWVYDPEVLARWAHPSTPRWSRSMAYWSRQLRRQGTDDLFWAEEDLSDTYTDLWVHAIPHATAATWKEVYQEGQDKLRLDSSWMTRQPPPDSFRWDDYSGLKYQYHLGRCALARVLPSSTRPVSSSAQVAAAMQGFLHHLGPVHHATPRSFVRHWMAWQGEHPLSSATHGQVRLIESWLRRLQPTLPKAVRPEGRWRVR